jgi:serine/threonine-protein kinase
MPHDPLAHRTTVRMLFDAVVDLHPAAQRVYLDEHCTDPSLRAEVEDLLSRVRLPQDVVQCAIEPTPPGGPPVTPGDLVGAYRIEREIGHGGMGGVYLASRADGTYHQRVALKIVQPGMDTAEIRERFRHERQTLAHLEHPNIARLLDGGTTEHGLPYFVMEYVEGEPIDRFCDRKQLSIDGRLRLFLRVCAAVGLAHQRLVVHRDLKPDNVLVTAANEPKLLDFGISKLLAPDEDSPDAAVRTRALVRLMTPRYASPEQVAGMAVTTASDVYSLGVLLYELLCGRYPYERAVTSGTSIETAVREKEPPAPSQAIAWRPAKPAIASTMNRPTPDDIARARSTTPAALARRLRGDLDTIVMRAMHKEPERRYASVEQLATDLQRHLDGLPVLARKDTFAYRAGKFVRRHRIGVAAACIALLSLVGGLTAAVWQARVAAIERDRARAEVRKADQIASFLGQVFAFADPSWHSAAPTSRGRDARVVDLLATAGARLDRELRDDPEVRAVLHRTIGATYGSLADYRNAEIHLRAALDLFRKTRGDEDLETATTLHQFGSLLLAEGNLAEAERTLASALAVRRRLLKAPDLVLATNLEDLATTRLQLGKDAKEALALYREAQPIIVKLLGSNHPGTALLLNNIASVYMRTGGVDDAVRTLREAIAIYERQANPPYEYGVSLSNLSALLRDEGRTADAEPYARRAIDVVCATTGDPNAFLAETMNELAEVLCAQKRYDEAEKQLRASLAMLDTLGAGQHPFHVHGEYTLGLVLARTGRLREAEASLRSALAKARAAHLARMVAVTEGNLGECLMAQRRYAEAEPLLVDSEAVLRARFGPDHFGAPEARQRLQQLYQHWKPGGQAPVVASRAKVPGR